MKSALKFAATLALAAIAGCASPEVDQIAQAQMIGLPENTILACLGEPVRRRSIGATEILSFADGKVWIAGEGFATFGYARHASCDVRVVLTKGRVSRVDYTGPGGGALDLGERCDFDVRRCVGP